MYSQKMNCDMTPNLHGVYKYYWLINNNVNRSFGVNALSGEIPPELGQLTGLRSL